MAALPSTHPLAPMLRHGTYVERMAEMITDTLRAEFMAMHGYRTKLFEFISDAHTPKNVMIVATKSNTHRAADAAKHLARIEALKTEFGIKHHALEALLGA